MPAKAFIDTNIVIYGLGPNSPKTSRAATLMADNPTISTQVLSETANVALKKLALPLPETAKLLAMLEAVCRIEIISQDTIHLALDVAGKYGFSWYDSLIVATALKAECTILYSEDMHHSQVIEGRLSIINPFLD
ncbi:MAG: PIN domain-containing protein [Gallionella sp.]|jgi:predicted nucleic acid-binding protein|nr:PIN domain-containing protein [Gallionella sp.]MCK9353990.1 PIN domain-containing protein [Gallionella sp.]